MERCAGPSLGKGREALAPRGAICGCVSLAVALLLGCSSEPASMGSMRTRGTPVAPGGGAIPSGDDGAAGSAGAGGGFGNTGDTEQAFDSKPPPMAPEPDPNATGDGEACVQDNAEATLEKLPIDIIFTIDTSGSMLAEIAGVQSNINANFASIIGASGIDYRVILIADDNVCISGALNPAGCGMSTPPTFYALYQNIGSHDTWCQLLDNYAAWSPYVRPEAYKVFVAISDDSPDCRTDAGLQFDNDQPSAAAFDAALLALDPAQFGTAAQRNYTYHSLVALAANTPATDAYDPADAIVTAECPTAAGNGVGYQYLSQLSGGLRFPVCEGNNFDAVFKKIAEGITKGAAVSCEFDIPAESSAGKKVDRDTIEVAYVPGDLSATIKFDRAADVAACATEAFFVEGDRVKLCPAACDAVRADTGAQVQVLFGCEVCGDELDEGCPTKPPPSLPPIK